MSVFVQYQHLHTILWNLFFIGFSVGQCEHTISTSALREVRSGGRENNQSRATSEVSSLRLEF